MGNSPPDFSRSRAADELRALADALDRHDVPEPALNAVAGELARLTAGLRAEGIAGRGPWWERGPDYRSSYEADSPFRGTHNPWAPQMMVQRRGESGSDAGAIGRVTLDRRWSGPPNRAHGGVLAGLFDELIGEAATHAEPDALAVTGRLSMRYRTPTPLGVPLHFEASITSRSTRTLTVTAACTSQGKLTATAEALMVVRRRRRHTEPR